jgi:hypothetical protein
MVIRMADKKPLWEVMLNAKIQYTRTNSSPTYGGEEAARLRALADEVVPEEPKPDYYVDTDMGWMVNAPATYRWEQRMATRALLLKAAAEAEGGP